MNYPFRIKPDGSIEWLGDPPPGYPMPGARTERFSVIVPDYQWHWHRFWFRVLRRIFGEHGKVAAWTRRWRCVWRCKILKGPHRGREERSIHRDKLIQWERNIWMGKFIPFDKL